MTDDDKNPQQVLVRYLTKTAIRVVVWVVSAYVILYFFPEATWVWWIVLAFIGISIVMAVLFGIVAATDNSMDPSKPYQTEEQFRANLERQLKWTPETLVQLREYGVTAESELKLEYFFYTPKQENADALAAVLAARGYEGRADVAAGNSSLFVVTGWTTPVQMNKATLLEWTEDMCRLGYSHDAEFDGWGTTPGQ